MHLYIGCIENVMFDEFLMFYFYISGTFLRVEIGNIDG